jgi:dihydroflavonol-4-reductase
MIVVTGATGHIGNVLVRLLLERKLEVGALVMPADNLQSLSGLNVKIIKGDITDSASLERAFRGIDTVFHLAGIVTIMPGMKSILERVNIAGTQNVVNACRKTGVHRLIYTSSIHAINEPPEGIPIDESQPFKSDVIVSDYASSKAHSSLLLLNEAKKTGLEIVIICPTGIIGPYDYNVSNIGQMILDFEKGHLKSYVSGAYDFVDVRDVANGLILAAEKGKNGRHYILSGNRIQVPELMHELAINTGKPAPTFRIPTLVAHSVGVLAGVFYRILRRKPVFTAYSIDVLKSNSLVSSARARLELGYTSRSWRESIRDQVKWFREVGMLSNRNI